MSIDEQTVVKVAKLARIKLDDRDVGPMTQELSAILDWIEQLGEVDVEGVDAMASTVAKSLPMREDVLATDQTGGGRPDEIVANAPKTDDHFFVVPKVVE
ncbi:glutamyl-tRNA(Gln) amidotransferase subunit C, putative [Parvularcula bermudensis HTCC2503]|uniref:Aspartyl/glutamyl-tRNA(Asn/Gln) amidotransferase subunit C n=1 Tax=Parvularcula bermudensis (strain ATCC BAA-594 / HTCC2503 / KCTC 12087) TaxID=314260 RepID=E0TCB7_PARBH|nr:Asp-tRNA(Asn)/Glu-tRNA(Gln) amidotransferase subunit GatC [Parvularcula bermudensis]ADM08550.1 glutamyl-tRNA(Gln) amidotransferase subunit C, putative [Parvularcula bermudensis HTCC2503]